MLQEFFGPKLRQSFETNTRINYYDYNTVKLSCCCGCSAGLKCLNGCDCGWCTAGDMLLPMTS